MELQMKMQLRGLMSKGKIRTITSEKAIKKNKMGSRVRGAPRTPTPLLIVDIRMEVLLITLLERHMDAETIDDFYLRITDLANNICILSVDNNDANIVKKMLKWKKILKTKDQGVMEDTLLKL
ncbi:uncharacterized protein [Miscanthus floridulus]|uniref:uncharacterized protein isoform X1 n=1 Tax=Miscanthus floridulus TaxID=154761 RepID=UPI00345AE7C0